MDYWTEGNRAFAFWDEDEYFYPATIITIDGGWCPEVGQVSMSRTDFTRHSSRQDHFLLIRPDGQGA